MKRKFLLLQLVIVLVFGTNKIFAQKNLWTSISPERIVSEPDARKIIPNKFQTFSLNTKAMLELLDQAPNEFTEESRNNPVALTIPMPDGSISRFKIVKTTIMEKGLSEQFPYFRTLGGQGIDDPLATIKIDWTDFGFRAQILSPFYGAVYIEPYSFDSKDNYTCFFKKDLMPKTPPIEEILPEALSKSVIVSRTNASQCVGGTLRSYRLAMACTGEYARAIGGSTVTQSQALSAIVTTVNRVDGVYETEVAVRLVLVANNALLVFTSPSTDPFNGNNNANTLINESQTQITNRIGTTNFDIGHTVSTGGGGLAGLGVICKNSQKASGITGSPSPTGDGYDIDYVAHEIGHQFGGDHTFNAKTGSCSGNGSSITNAEPGSGITIMAYAGICNATNDLALHSIPYFHAVSLDQIATYTINSTGNNCAVKIATGNLPPVVNAGVNYVIPKSTPFVLSGSAIDPDLDTMLFSWEQVDVGAAFGNWNAPVGNKAPLFRSFPPTASGKRYFPQLSDQINNVTTIGELLPSYARPMKFRLTARDNKAVGGGVCFDEMTVTVAATGPFVVTSPTTSTVNWLVGATKNVTWNVAGTTATPVSAANVDIELSADGGLTFPIVLKLNTPNDGSESITVPNNVTTNARVRVKASGNIFYDMSDANFTIARDKISPIINCNNDTSIKVTTGCSKSIALNNPSVSDNSGNLSRIIYQLTGATVFSSAASGLNFVGTRTFNAGITKITYIATDPSGNADTCSFTVSVIEKILPTIVCPSNIISCIKSIKPAFPIYDDNCSVTVLTWKMAGATTGTSAVSGINLLGAKTFIKGTTLVTYSVKDASGNAANCTFSVKVDSIKPTITKCPVDTIINVATCPANATINSLNAKDNCGIRSLTWKMTGATVASSPTTGINQVGTKSFNKGFTTITYTIKDSALNATTCSQKVKVNTSAACKQMGNRVEVKVKTDDFIARLLPNPTTSNFVLSVTSMYNNPIEINIYSVEGKRLQQIVGKVQQTYKFGEKNSRGAYLIEVKQGDKRMTLIGYKQ